MEVGLTAAGRTSPLFQGLRPRFHALQWHGAAILKLPEGAVVLAENDHCPIQAIQMGERAFGIQYHVELTDKTVPEWGLIPEYRAELEAITGPGGQEALEAATAEAMPALKAAAQTLYRNFRAIWG